MQMGFGDTVRTDVGTVEASDKAEGRDCIVRFATVYICVDYVESEDV